MRFPLGESIEWTWEDTYRFKCDVPSFNNNVYVYLTHPSWSSKSVTDE